MDGTFHTDPTSPQDRPDHMRHAPGMGSSGTQVHPVPAYDVRHLVGRGTTAHMILDGQTYCLRITRSGKLILTK